MRWVDWYGDGSLWVLDVALACCTLEFDAAALVAAAPLPTLDDRAQVAVVISGTVTDRLAPAVAAIIDGCEQQAGRRPAVISFGACASSGGPYWDSYARGTITGLTRGTSAGTSIEEATVYGPAD